MTLNGRAGANSQSYGHLLSATWIDRAAWCRIGVMSSSHLKSAILAAFLLLLLLLSATPAPGAGLPARLEDVHLETLHRLELLYGMERKLALKPIDITFADPGEEAFESWGGVPDYAGGVAMGERGRIIVVPSRAGKYPYGDEAQILQHELSHVLLHRALGFHPPRWINEGLAMRAAGEWGFEDVWYMVFALPGVKLGEYTLGGLESGFREGNSRRRRSYALARAFVGDLFPDDRELTGFIVSARALESVEEAFRARYGESPEEAFQLWALERPVWREWAVVIGSSRTAWAVVLLVYLAVGVYAQIRRRRSYKRLPE